ncbi:c-type cytochrome [Rhodopirellula sp. MGV]|uniref:c-type cytochrome n=1 Tax=Rhodopirellula sp. MGV TaxID=2023130 RepID=UPI000B97B7F2|nr:c-type cytochrome [Rhodopirellula sp. MGV]OYP31594.1 cytochrome C [Rhodopirellula sp. MGV]PNY36320.1 cytochrome C [Rhodopirellula baltica]PNY37721.1 cytochrome C [Rhodopirellula baltica]
MLNMIPAAITLLADQTESKLSLFPKSASTFSSDSDWIFHFITIVALIFFIAIVIALFGFALKYKKAKGQQAESQTDHNTTIELVWSIGPSFLLIVMFYFGAQGFLNHRTIPEGAYDLGVDAYKWGWGINYGKFVIHPELHVVAGEPTKLTMTSKDVIHSLYIPAFRVKKDIVPGRFNYMWFKATEPSEKIATDEELEQLAAKDAETNASWDYDARQFTPDGYSFYDLYCAEYCGTNHSQMQTVVVVHETREDLEAWIKKYSSRPSTESPASYGEKLYQRRGCKSCHSIDGTKLVGPSWKDLAGKSRPLASGESVTADENYLRESILNPKAKIAAGFQPVMPSYKGQLTDDDIYSLIEYIKSLGEAGASGGETTAAEGEGQPAEAAAE